MVSNVPDEARSGGSDDGWPEYNRDDLSEDEMNGLLGEFFSEALEDFSSSRWRSRSSSSRST
jgi:hypothetical protein